MKAPSTSDAFLGLTIASTVLLVELNVLALFLLR
jgi:hypothetical protein